MTLKFDDVKTIGDIAIIPTLKNNYTDFQRSALNK